MSYVSYDGKRLIPAPFVNISKQYTRSGESEILSKTYTIEIVGQMLEFKGSPNSDGDFWTLPGYPPDEDIPDESKLGALLRKQQAIQELFSSKNEGKSFEIQSGDGSEPLKCYPKIVSIEFPNDRWYNRFNYSIVLTCDQIFPLDNEDEDGFISDATENWNIEPQQEREEAEEGGDLYYDLTYSVSHSVSANGKRIYDENGLLLSGREPWEWGRDWVRSRLGFNSNIIHGTVPGHYKGYNYAKSETVDNLTGNFSATENWTLASGNTLEQYDLSISKGISTGLKSVSIQGQITGFEENVGSGRPSQKIDNAVAKFNQVSGANLPFIRSQNFLSEIYPGLLNPIPTQETVTKNPFEGTLSYTFEYDTRPANILNALSEKISVTYQRQNQKHASVFVLGRKFGPVLQDLGTSDAQQKSLNIDVVLEPSINPSDLGNSFKFPFNLISGLVYELDPFRADNAVYSYSGQPNETYDPYTGIGNYNLTWTFEQ